MHVQNKAATEFKLSKQENLGVSSQSVEQRSQEHRNLGEREQDQATPLDKNNSSEWVKLRGNVAWLEKAILMHITTCVPL